MEWGSEWRGVERERVEAVVVMVVLALVLVLVLVVLVVVGVEVNLVEAPRSFFPFFRSRLGFARDRKGHLSPAPQKCDPCRSSCMSQIIQKRKGNHKKSCIFGLRAVFRDPYRTFSPSEAALFLSFFQKKRQNILIFTIQILVNFRPPRCFCDPYRTFSPSEAAFLALGGCTFYFFQTYEKM